MPGRRQATGAAAWLSELVWRDFFFAILSARPDVQTRCYRHQFDALAWDDDERTGKHGAPVPPDIRWSMRRCGNSRRRGPCTIGCAWSRPRSSPRISASTGGVANDGLLPSCSTMTSPRTTAAGNGVHRQAATPNPGFASSTPSPSRAASIRRGGYIRSWLPELGRVPDEHVHAPWEMTSLEQRAAGCRIGRDYPEPIVRHDVARQRTLARFKAVGGGAGRA